MSIITGILLSISAIITVVFASYLFWEHSKRNIDTRPEEVANLAKKNKWTYSAKSRELDQLIEAKGLGYMGGEATIKNVCVQEQPGQTIYIFDCMAATPISGIAFEFEEANLLQMQVVEKLITNRLNQLPSKQIETEQLPKFVKAKVSVYAMADLHGQVCMLLNQNNDLQALLKQRDLGYFCMQANCAVFYFLTRYPAEQRDFGKVVKRAEQISKIFGS